MVKFCPTCKKVYPITTTVCPGCHGTNLMRFCQNCKKMLPPGAVACPGCGDTDTTKTTSSKTVPHKGKKKKSKAPFILALILAVLTGAAGWHFLSSFLFADKDAKGNVSDTIEDTEKSSSSQNLDEFFSDNSRGSENPTDEEIIGEDTISPVQINSYKLGKDIIEDPTISLNVTNTTDKIIKSYTAIIFAYDDDNVPVKIYFNDFVCRLDDTDPLKANETRRNDTYWTLYGNYNEIKKVVGYIAQVEFYDEPTWENPSALALYNRYNESILEDGDENILTRE